MLCYRSICVINIIRINNVLPKIIWYLIVLIIHKVLSIIVADVLLPIGKDSKTPVNHLLIVLVVVPQLQPPFAP
jgi:hypothetical protein